MEQSKIIDTLETYQRAVAGGRRRRQRAAAAVAAVGVAPHRAVPVAGEVPFREVPVAVAEAVFLRELTAELRVEYLLPLPAHREKRITVLSHPAKQHQKKRGTGKTAQVRK